MLLSKEEREANLLSKFKNAISKSLENLNIKNLLDVRPDTDKESVIEDDNVSVSTSRYFANGMSKGYKNVKLPFIIGTQEFFRNEYLGISPSEGALAVQNNQEDPNAFERKISTVSEMNRNINILDDLNPNNQNFGESNGIPNIPQINNNGVKSNVPSVPNVPAVPKVPVVPKVPAPPLMKKNTTENLPKVNQPIFEEVNTMPITNENNFNFKNESNFNNEISSNIMSNNTQQTLQTNPLSFKDSLNQKFGGGISGASANTNNLINNQVSTMNQPNSNNYNDTNLNLQQNTMSNLPSSLAESKKPKQIKLDQFIKRGTGLFNDDEDDEEDRTGLFKRAPIDNRLGRATLFDTRITNNLPKLEKPDEPKKTDIFLNSNEKQMKKII
jgi:hypothetical protein